MVKDKTNVIRIIEKERKKRIKTIFKKNNDREFKELSQKQCKKLCHRFKKCVKFNKIIRKEKEVEAYLGIIKVT